MKHPSNTLIIIGNGVAGITAALEFRKHSTAPVVVLSDEHPYFFSRTALMYVFMGHMKWEHLEPYEPTFWKQQNITLVQDRVLQLEATTKTLHTASGKSYAYGQLLMATGSEPRKAPWPGKEAKGVQGLYHKQDLEQLEALTPNIATAVVIGGGLIGVELAEMLHSRGKRVIFLIREQRFWDQVLSKEEAQCVTEHLIQHGIEVHCDTTVAAFESSAKGELSAVKTTDDLRFEAQFAGVTIGVTPQIEIFKNSGLNVNKGILVDAYLKTNLKDVYAAGDCAELQQPPQGRNSIEPVWYSGRSMGAAVGSTLAGKPIKYDPGTWFNSAKFFDIEYQTYGSIANKADATTTHWFWKHPTKNCSFRIAYDSKSSSILGFSTLGLRLRQNQCIQWIEAKTPVHQVMNDLMEAHFDPEFSPRYLKKIQQQFLSQHPTFVPKP